MARSIGFSNAANTIVSFLRNLATVARTYTFQDRDGTIADLTDITTSQLNRQTDSYTLVLADAGKVIEMNKASANNLTVPLNATEAFPTGTNIYIVQYGAGLTTVVATGGVTINSSSGGLTAPSQHSVMLLQKVGTNEWRLTNGSAIGEWVNIASPSWGGFGTAPTGTMKYVKIGKMVTLTFRSTALGVSNATTKTLTLPFAAAALSTGVVTGITNSGTASDTVGCWFINSVSSTTLDIFRNATTFTWTNTGNCRFDFIVTYESTT